MKRQAIKLKKLLVLPVRIVAGVLAGVAMGLAIIAQTVDDIGRNHWLEDRAGTYDFKYDDGLGVKEMY